MIGENNHIENIISYLISLCEIFARSLTPQQIGNPPLKFVFFFLSLNVL
jgi:hypothetical protein